MRINAKRLHLAFRSPGHLGWAQRHVLRSSPLGGLDRLLLRGWSFRPQLITVNITGRCNLRCEMCMQPRGAAGNGDTTTLRSAAGAGRELTPEEWCGVVDQAASAHPVFYFSGGEPLLYRGLDQVLAHVKRRGLIAALVTNGSVLARHAERLVEIGVDNVTVSLDGPEAVHDAIRGVPGAFRRAVEGIRSVQSAKRLAGSRFPTLKINCVITQSSLPTLAETYAIARELGVDECSLQHPMFDTEENVALHNRLFRKAMETDDAGGGAGAEDANLSLKTRHSDTHGEAGQAFQPASQTQAGKPAPLSSSDAPAIASKQAGEFYSGRITEAECADLERTLDRLVAEAEGHSPRLLFFPTVRRRDWRGYYLDVAHPFPRDCRAPWNTLRLLADGTFEPCLRYAIGNVLDTPLWEMWNAPRMRRFRRTLTRARLFPACARCCYRCF